VELGSYAGESPRYADCPNRHVVSLWAGSDSWATKNGEPRRRVAVVRVTARDGGVGVIVGAKTRAPHVP
jgi:hypothetical protein